VVLKDTRAAARLYSSFGIGTVVATLMMVPGYVPAGGVLGLGGRILFLVSVVASGAAFVRCPRQHMTHKAVTLACFMASVFFATAFVGRYAVSLLSDRAAGQLLLAYERLGF